MTVFGPPTGEQLAATRALFAKEHAAAADPRVDVLVAELIGRAAGKWMMLVLEHLAEHGVARFSELSRLIPGVSQKMLTQTLRQMERDGLVDRRVYPVVPPRVEYRLTGLGLTLGAAFCGLWIWAAENAAKVDAARADFDAEAAGG